MKHILLWIAITQNVIYKRILDKPKKL